MESQKFVRMRSARSEVIGALVLFFFLQTVFSGLLWAQLSTASINGIVKDTSNAVIPGATVVLQSVDTGVRRSAVTNGAGVYVILNIPPGRYTLRASKAGFQTSERIMTLAVNQTSANDFMLSVGTSAQTILVSGAATTLETSTAELGTVMTTKEINDLPLNGRNFTQLLTLTPGASPVNVSQNTAQDAVGSFSFPAINGQRNRSNLFLLDGVNDQGSVLSTYAVPPIVDDIQEFKVDSHNDQVQFGGVTGGVVNVVTKSGTNMFHGTLWEFLRNSAMDARNPFFVSVQQLRQNQFGANLGGPVVLPHYNGHDKTFFFGSYEGFRSSTPNQTLALIPTPAEIQGNLGDIGIPIYNPFTTRPDPNNPNLFIRDIFPGGVIPPGLLDPVMVHLAQAVYPSPNATGIPRTNFTSTTPSEVNQNEYSIRIDEQLTKRDSFWFRFSNISLPQTSVSPIGNTLATKEYNAHNLGVNWTHTFGSSGILQVEFGRTRSDALSSKHMGSAPPGLVNSFAPTFTCGFQANSSCLLPNVTVIGFTAIPGEAYATEAETDIWAYQANFSKLAGRHLFNAGFSFATNNLAESTFFSSVGFDAFQTANLESPGSTGSALASLLLGVPTQSFRSNRHGAEHNGWVDGVYFGDQWKATDHLTINAGVRWDLTLIPTWGKSSDRSNQVGTLDLENGTYILQNPVPFCSAVGTPPCIPGSVIPDHVVISPNGKLFHTDYRNISPRLGVAYRIGSNMVVRASGGIFYDNWATWTQAAQSPSGLWPQVINARANNLNQNIPNVTAENPLSSTGAGALPSPTPFTQVAYYQDPNMRDPYSEQWNLGIEQQLGTSTALSLNYVGAHSSRLSLGDYGNTATVPGPGPIVNRQPIPYIRPTNYNRSNGKSGYNALQASLQRNLSSGLSYLVSYTWSKSMDLACSGYGGVEGCAIQNPYDLKADYSVSAFDLTNMLTASWTYQLPFGKTGSLSTGNRVLDYGIKGWSLNGIVSLDSGPPYQVGVSGDIANTGNSSSTGYYERLNQVGNPQLAHPSRTEWFNTKAFAVPAAFTFGNVGRNSLRADWNKNVDASVFRDFPVTESKYFEFRAEAFNVTNTPVWGIPDNNFRDKTFGEVLATANTPRQLQLALKFYF